MKIDCLNIIHELYGVKDHSLVDDDIIEQVFTLIDCELLLVHIFEDCNLLESSYYLSQVFITTFQKKHTCQTHQHFVVESETISMSEPHSSPTLFLDSQMLYSDYESLPPLPLSIFLFLLLAFFHIPVLHQFLIAYQTYSCFLKEWDLFQNHS